MDKSEARKTFVVSVIFVCLCNVFWPDRDCVAHDFHHLLMSFDRLHCCYSYPWLDYYNAIGSYSDSEAGINGRVPSFLRPVYRATSARVCFVVNSMFNIVCLCRSFCLCLYSGSSDSYFLQFMSKFAVSAV